MSEQTQATYSAAEFLNDIPFGLAEQAHSGTSHVPEIRAETERNSYTAHIAEFYNAIMAIAGDERRAEALADLERYRTGYADRYRTMLARRSRCVSTMIAGPSNFPKRQQEKRWASADNAVRDLLEWSKRVCTKIYRKYTGTDVIRTGDAGAVEALEKKITTLEDKQEYMKAINKILKGKKSEEEKTEQLLALDDDMTESSAKTILKCGGYQHFELTNNNATIKRTKEQLAKAKSLSSQETTEIIVGDVRMVNNVENNRLELHFPNRTSKHVYELLKSHGFRYTPSKSVASAGCFQAFRGRNADHWAAVIIAQYNAEAGAA